MKVALIGVTGMVGSRIAAELVSRGHSVTGISRSADREAAVKKGVFLPESRVAMVQGDATDVESLVPLISGHAVLISASNFRSSSPDAVIEAAKKASVPRLVVVGGAASLEASPGVLLRDTPGFPVAYREEADAGIAFLARLRKEHDIEWTFISPSAEFRPGQRTGTYRLGKNRLILDEDGKSFISVEDFAVALVDEVENPQHIDERFTVGY